MEVHHRFDEESVRGQAVNDGVREAMEVELAAVAPKEPPAFGLGDDPVQGGFQTP